MLNVEIYTRRVSLGLEFRVVCAGWILLSDWESVTYEVDMLEFFVRESLVTPNLGCLRMHQHQTTPRLDTPKLMCLSNKAGTSWNKRLAGFWIE